jgi:hypothetical protein
LQLCRAKHKHEQQFSAIYSKLFKYFEYEKMFFVNRSGSRGVTSDDGHITIKILADTDRSRGSSNIYILEVGDSPLNPNPGGNGQKRPTFFLS